LITPLLGDVAAGDDVSVPPRDVAFDHVAPFQVLYQRALSLPRTNRKRLSTIAGDEVGVTIKFTVTLTVLLVALV
jgi:uncharacterized membrane protein YagU involved in acid resistance